MSLYRRAHWRNRDKSEPEIRKALALCGYHVWDHLPCDLLVWRPDVQFRTLEVKTPRGKAQKARIDPRQEAQKAFLELTGTPVVLTPEEALQVLAWPQ